MAEVSSILQTCDPRPDVLGGGLADSHFAAQLDQVVRNPAGYPVYGVKGGNTLSNSRELVIAAVNVTLPDASADIPHLTQRPYCLPLSA